MPYRIIFKCYDCGKHHEDVQMLTLNDALEHIKEGNRVVYLVVEDDTEDDE